MATITTGRDPTRTKTLRERFRARYNARWRDVRGAARRELRDDRGLRGTLDASRTVAVFEFRTWLEREIEATVLEPESPSAIRRGYHWTGKYVRDAYKAGLRRAETQLRGLGYDEQTIARATNIRRDAHQSGLRSEFVGAYHDTEDACWRTVSATSKAFRDAFEERGEPQSEQIRLVTSEIASTGPTATDRDANTRIVETYNGALGVAFALAEVRSVGIQPESTARTNAYADRIHATPRRERRRPRVNFDWSGARKAIDDETDLAETIPEGHLPEEDFDETVFEWQTAGDERVCEDCGIMSGTPYSLSEVLDRDGTFPPFHPRCRCSLVALS